MRGILLSIFLVAASDALAQDAKRGEEVFQQCRPCHRIGPDAKNILGPTLNGLFGRRTGSVPGYAYSTANRESGIVWTEATFAQYIRDPRAMIPNTRMIFGGIKDDGQVRDLIAYLKQFP